MPPPPTLPNLNLTPTPTSHPSICLSLSTTLLNLLTSTINNPSCKILSIGSGSGLLEALLEDHLSTTTAGPEPVPTSAIIHGVEPHPGTANKYLSSENLHLVSGTWAVFAEALEYDVWMFVYPRARTLVVAYLDLLLLQLQQQQQQQQQGGREEEKGRVLVWAGPRVDWEEEYCGCFTEMMERGRGRGRMDVYEGMEGGVAEWEVVVLMSWDDDVADAANAGVTGGEMV